MFTSGVDRIVNNEVSTRVFDQLVAPNKKRSHIKEAWHDLMFDPEIDQVVDEVATFVSQNLLEKAVRI